LVYRPIRKKGRSEKLLHPFHGPFVIAKRLSAVNYAVYSTRDKKKRIDQVHVCNLKHFISRVLVHRPLLIPSIPRDPVSTKGRSDRRQCEWLDW
jgi:hypothetical protein